MAPRAVQTDTIDVSYDGWCEARVLPLAWLSCSIPLGESHVRYSENDESYRLESDPFRTLGTLLYRVLGQLYMEQLCIVERHLMKLPDNPNPSIDSVGNMVSPSEEIHLRSVV